MSISCVVKVQLYFILCTTHSNHSTKRQQTTRDATQRKLRDRNNYYGRRSLQLHFTFFFCKLHLLYRSFNECHQVYYNLYYESLYDCPRPTPFRPDIKFRMISRLWFVFIRLHTRSDREPPNQTGFRDRNKVIVIRKYSDNLIDNGWTYSGHQE